MKLSFFCPFPIASAKSSISGFFSPFIELDYQNPLSISPLLLSAFDTYFPSSRLQIVKTALYFPLHSKKQGAGGFEQKHIPNRGRQQRRDKAPNGSRRSTDVFDNRPTARCKARQGKAQGLEICLWGVKSVVDDQIDGFGYLGSQLVKSFGICLVHKESLDACLLE